MLPGHLWLIVQEIKADPLLGLIPFDLFVFFRQLENTYTESAEIEQSA
ncbi:hypothetical protein GCM10027036_19840 [Flavihumibacter cheonanensis]